MRTVLVGKAKYLISSDTVVWVLIKVLIAVLIKVLPCKIACIRPFRRLR